MVNGETSDILFWEDYSKYQNFVDELKSKYDLDDRTQVEKFLDEIEAFKLRMISSKEEFIRRIRYYAVHGKPCWVQGSSKQINMLTESDLDNSFKFALEDFSDKCIIVWNEIS